MSRVEQLKDKGLTQWKYTNSQKNYCIVPDYNGGQVVIFKETPATNWEKYIKATFKAGLEDTGYVIDVYKNGKGIKKTKVGKMFCDLSRNYWKHYGYRRHDGKQNIYPRITGKQFANLLNKEKEVAA